MGEKKFKNSEFLKIEKISLQVKNVERNIFITSQGNCPRVPRKEIKKERKCDFNFVSLFLRKKEKEEGNF